MTDSPARSVPTPEPPPTDTPRLARPLAPRVLLRSLDAVRGMVLGTVITLGAAAHVQAEEPVPGASSAPQVDRALQQLMTDHRCTTTGLPDDAIPASTLLRRPDGQLRVVSFDRGWAAHQGTAPGTLVAVCQGPRDR